MELVFATANLHKLEEAQHILAESVQLISPARLGYTQDIPETGNTLEDNALQKARTIWQALGRDCFADDTGLEIDALQGAPGVYSARYAGPRANMQDNIDKVLAELQGQTCRKARFRCVIALILQGKEYLFEGQVLGEMLESREGGSGFGYDPIFRPLGYSTSFATMSAREKNAISHRALALDKLRKFLQTKHL
jgi:non-canonical purine NTP pyrophosphatase, rdgB/HAM1 family